MIDETYVENDLGKLTLSETKALERYKQMGLIKLLYACRSNGGYLLLYIDRLTVKPKQNHVPPFKYNRLVINKWGKLNSRYCGNIWDEEYRDIMDDWSKF